MAENNGKTNGQGNNEDKNEKSIEERLEPTFDLYMFDCQKKPSIEKFLGEIAKRLDTSIKLYLQIPSDDPEEEKIVVALSDRGEIVYNSTKRYKEISIDSSKKDLHDLFFYVVHNFYPKNGKAYYYGNSEESIDLPKYFGGNDIPTYAKEIRDNYHIRPTMLEDMAKLRFNYRGKAIESLEQKVEVSSNNKDKIISK